jgi:hypothetical protein
MESSVMIFVIPDRQFLAVFNLPRGGRNQKVEKMDKDIVSFARKALNRHLKHIVDDVFVEIQENMLGDYLRLIEKRIVAGGSGDSKMVRILWADIGDAIKKLLNLDDAGIGKKPKSHLIDRYTEHKLKKSPKSIV